MKDLIFRFFLFVIALILVLFILGELKFITFPQNIPNPVGYVNDYGNVLSTEQKDSLNNLIENYEKKTSVEIAIVTLDSLGDQNINEYTLKLANKWKVGKKDSNNGIIILNSIKDRRFSIEIGKGLEKYFSDSFKKSLINIYMIPYLKQGKYFAAYDTTIKVIIIHLQNKPNINKNYHDLSIKIFIITITVLLIILCIYLIKEKNE